MNKGCVLFRDSSIEAAGCRAANNAHTVCTHGTKAGSSGYHSKKSKKPNMQAASCMFIDSKKKRSLALCHAVLIEPDLQVMKWRVAVN